MSNLTKILQFLKKIFLDDPIARTKRYTFWVVHFVIVHIPAVFTNYHYWYFHRLLKVNHEGCVEVLHLESQIVYGCNLHCEFCIDFSPYQKGYVPADELLTSYAQWRKKVRPRRFVLTGGEPFLHPELARIIRESAKIWEGSKLWLNTNGLLLDRAKPEVLQAVKETGYELIITEHTCEPEHRNKLDTVYARLKKEGFRFVVRPSGSTWLALYQYDNKGALIPYKSNPKRAWGRCLSRTCTIISGDRLYKCTPLLCVRDAVQKGILDAADWKAALTYQPLTLQSTAEEIIAHLRHRAVPECTICPEKNVTVPARQLPVKAGE